MLFIISALPTLHEASTGREGVAGVIQARDSQKFITS